MKSNAATVEEYLASLPEDRRGAVEAVRRVILANLDEDYEERMVWGVIGYAVPQRVYPAGHHTDPTKPLMMAGLSSQKNDLVVYLMNVYGGGGGLGGDPALRDWFERAWAKGEKAGACKPLCVSGEGGGGCCVRFKKLDDLALDVIGESIRRTPARAFVERYVTMLAERGRGPDGKPLKRKSSGPRGGVAGGKRSGAKVAKKLAKRSAGAAKRKRAPR